MSIIKKKILPEYFTAVASGRKRFELRLADFEIKEGDTLFYKKFRKILRTF